MRGSERRDPVRPQLVRTMIEPWTRSASTVPPPRGQVKPADTQTVVFDSFGAMMEALGGSGSRAPSGDDRAQGRGDGAVAESPGPRPDASKPDDPDDSVLSSEGSPGSVPIPPGAVAWAAEVAFDDAPRDADLLARGGEFDGKRPTSADPGRASARSTPTPGLSAEAEPVVEARMPDVATEPGLDDAPLLEDGPRTASATENDEAVTADDAGGTQRPSGRGGPRAISCARKGAGRPRGSFAHRRGFDEPGPGTVSRQAHPGRSDGAQPRSARGVAARSRASGPVRRRSRPAEPVCGPAGGRITNPCRTRGSRDER